ncbi:MAG: molybdopterin synthase sulfur carrier subunit [Rhodospirillaceae bacterium]|nr:MAG: molybdopterin synthase sulfur carrier subunit [Rhodospirillaceae bacterium]
MKILYFAWVKMKVGIAEEDVTVPEGVTDVAGLIAWLCARTPRHAAAFADLSIIRAAVDQEYVPFHHPVDSAREVAFFPPVTGG